MADFEPKVTSVRIDFDDGIQERMAIWAYLA